jgi:hypothetical protein
MNPKKNKTKKWIVFGIVAVIAVLIAVVPALVGKRNKEWKKPPSVDFMIKVTGTIKQAKDETLYLKGDNNLYYILLGDKTSELLNNKDKRATVFGNIIVTSDVAAGIDNTKVDGNSVRMRISVIKFDLV